MFPGMTFKGISLRGPKRTFTVVSVNGTSSQGRFGEESIVTIVGRDSDSAPLLKPNGLHQRLKVTNIAGIDQALKKLNGLLSNFDREFKFTKAKRSCGVLLHGGRGTGKTLILDKIAATGWGKVYEVDRDAKATTIRTVFKDAKLSQPSIIVMDDLEDMVSRDDSVSRDITKTLAKELDDLVQNHHSNSLPRILVIAATREPSNIPMSLKKIRRFETEVALPVPDTAARKSILESLDPPLRPDVKDEIIDKIGDRTHAYTAEDLEKLLNAAYEIAENRLADVDNDPDKDYFLEQADLEAASALVRPTAMHDITLKPPSVRWNQIGGQDSVKKALRRAVEIPLLVSICLFLPLEIY
jgi:AAA family ATPase